MRKIIMLLTVAVLLSGCSLAGDKKVGDSSTAVIATTEPTATPIPKKKWYKKNESVKLLSEDGSKVVGTFKLNQVERERINDWKNTKAVNNSVNYSFSFNMTVDFSKSKDDFADLTIKCEPRIVGKDGQKLSSTCNVGWSGFPDKAELFSENPRKTIEVGAQPEVPSLAGSHIEIVIRDQNDVIYDVVKFKRKVIKKCRVGAKLLSGNDKVKIRSKNGAVYALSAKDVFYERHMIYSNENIANYSNSPEANFFDIVYHVDALQKPKNSSFVENITTYKGKSALLSNFTIGLDTLNVKSLLYQDEKRAQRRVYSDRDDVQPYVTEKLEVPFGYMADITTNRQASDLDSVKPTYVRLRFEFQNEANAVSEKKRMHFSGRYVVFQVKITNRKMFTKRW